MDNNQTSLSTLSGSSLDEVSKSLVDQIVDEQDPDKLKNLVSLFNVNQSKKNLVRVEMFSRLMDKISIQMMERFEKKPGEFSNKDLLDYLSAVRSAIDKNDINIDNMPTPIIQNNTQVNISVDTLDRNSKERVADAVKSILSKLSSYDDIVDVSDLDDKQQSEEWIIILWKILFLMKL